MTPSLVSPRSRRTYMAHPRGDQLRRARQAGEYEWSTFVRATAAGAGLALFFLGLPLIGAIACAVLGIDPNAAIR